MPDAATSLAAHEFSAVFEGWAESFSPAPGYRLAAGAPVAYRVGDGGQLPAEPLDEHWRRLYLDVTSPPDVRDPAFLDRLADWLVTEQPITLGVNGDCADSGYPVASRLFERTAQVVYSVGTPEQPCLTCQAQPQNGEIFGEFPPRRQLAEFTRFPVIVPSATAGYCAEYTEQHLAAAAAAPPPHPDAAVIVALAAGAGAKGYVNTLAAYLVEAAVGPREGHGARTCLWGLQRPPLGGGWERSGCAAVELRLDAAATRDGAAAHVLPFYMTNARDQLRVSVDPAAVELAEALVAVPGLDVVIEGEPQFAARTAPHPDPAAAPWAVVRPGGDGETAFPLAAHFVSIMCPLGHIKSTKSPERDDAFVAHFSQSAKWLRAR